MKLETLGDLRVLIKTFENQPESKLSTRLGI